MFHSPVCGVFDDVDEMDMFFLKCKMCSRLKNNCSVLNGLLESRVMEEVGLNDVGGKECLKFKVLKGDK